MVVDSTVRRTAGGTQSFIHVLGECWSRPSLVALEILWRWLFGIPMLAVLAWQGLRIYFAIANRLAATGIDQFSLVDPMQAAVIVSDVYAVIMPPIFRAASWIVPVALLVWAAVSGIGRNAVLRRYDPSLPRRWFTLSGLQLLRILFLGGSFVLWFALVQWAGNSSLSGDEPNLVAYCALVICLSLGIFTVWALVSWVFSIAPLLVLLEDRGIGSSLVRSLRLGPLTGKLVEINLILGIVKLALVVLAMVFSAIPLPFASNMEGPPLYAWWVVVSVLYLAASDFFQVARLIAFIQLWRGLRSVSGEHVFAATTPEVK
jgi:hypothetical protein